MVSVMVPPIGTVVAGVNTRTGDTGAPAALTPMVIEENEKETDVTGLISPE